MVATASITLIILNMILGLAVPIGLLIFFKVKYHASLKCYFTGCAVMLIFAFMLEQLVHTVVLGSAAGAMIQGNILLYALYGGLMAGLFEETGRFLAMRFVLKKEQGNDHNALMYGAGHGGLEMFVLLSIGMINNLVYSLALNMGQAESLLAPLDDPARSTLQAGFDALLNTPSWQFLLSPAERIAAITAQIGLSVIVWFGAKQKKAGLWLLILAILLHAVLDAVSVIAAGSGMSLILVEVLIYLMAAGIAGIAVKVWRTQK